jgi:hypothetical protein
MTVPKSLPRSGLTEVRYAYLWVAMVGRDVRCDSGSVVSSGGPPLTTTRERTGVASGPRETQDVPQHGRNAQTGQGRLLGRHVAH